MTGRRTSTPTRRNACVASDEAACQIVYLYGTIIGKRLIARPRYDITKSATAQTKGAASERLLSARHSASATSAVTIGTGASQAMFGQENQRSAMWGWT